MQRILLYGRDEINKQLPKAVISCEHEMAAFFFLCVVSMVMNADYICFAIRLSNAYYALRFNSLRSDRTLAGGHSLKAH